MQRDMVIAACQVAHAPAIPDRDKDEIWNGRRELALPYRKSPIFVLYRIYWSDS